MNIIRRIWDKLNGFIDGDIKGYEILQVSVEDIEEKRSKKRWEMRAIR
jgi:hypothetical protein